MAICSRCGENCSQGARFCRTCGAPVGDEAREARKTVTVLFSDLAESTSLAERLDPEALRLVLGRYFACARQVLERHGGTVEKFIGDAVLAIFGIPAAHEDDALRAVRAAVELRAAIAGLNVDLEPLGIELLLRTGVNTGEVALGGAAGGQSFVTGDAVVTAKRLEEAAPPGEVLLGPATYALVRDAVEADLLTPLELKGKSEPLAAHLLRALRPGAAGVERQLDSPLVGRAYEFATLQAAFTETAAARECRLVTVLGPAGIGKTRLVREHATAFPEVRLLSGRCLPYGDGITYWPFVEIVRQACGLSGEEPAAQARERIAALVAPAEDGERIVNGVAAALALGEASADELFWAVRRLLEEVAGEEPLFVVIDDLQWAEPVFLDLVEYVTARSRGFALLLCCVSRPELLDSRPHWAVPRARATTVVLEELPPEDARALIFNLLGSELGEEACERVAAAAEGNPLFLEEVLRMLIDQGVLKQAAEGWRLTADPRRLELPPTINALLSARLDRLEPQERLVIERAAVVGEFFSWSAVEALVSSELHSSVGECLQALVRKEFIRPVLRAARNEDEFRFGHILVRDAAYAGLPKGERAELHERLVRFIDSRFAGGIEADEIGGYHLEQAAGARSELDPLDEHARALAEEAAARLAAAARRALGHGDTPAAASLLERTVALLPEDSLERLELLVELGDDALRLLGRFEEADDRLREATERGAALGHVAVAKRAAFDRAFLQLFTRPSEGTDAFLKAAREVLPMFEELGDDAGLVHAWTRLAEVYWVRLEISRMQEALERALAAASGAGRRERSYLRTALARAAILGPTPVDEALRLCSELATQTEGDRTAEALVDLYRGYLEALDGSFEAARTRAAGAAPVLEELGKQMLVASAQRLFAGQIELLAGDAAAAEAYFLDGYQRLEGLGEHGNLAGLAAYLAAAVQAQGRDAEADELAAAAARDGNPDDAEVHTLWRMTRARIRTAAGLVAEAEQLAREAVAIAERTDVPTLRGDALLTLAFVLGSPGANGDVGDAARTALALYEAKGNRVGAREARELLASEAVNVR